MAKTVHFENLKLVVKKCYQKGNFQMRHFGWFSNVVSITYLVNLKGKILETIKAREPDLLFPFYPESHLKSL